MKEFIILESEVKPLQFVFYFQIRSYHILWWFVVDSPSFMTVCLQVVVNWPAIDWQLSAAMFLVWNKHSCNWSFKKTLFLSDILVVALSDCNKFWLTSEYVWMILCFSRFLNVVKYCVHALYNFFRVFLKALKYFSSIIQSKFKNPFAFEVSYWPYEVTIGIIVQES